MKEIEGSLWDRLGEAIVVITVSATVTARGECPMPRGCARQARERFPGLPRRLGELIRVHGSRVFDLGGGLVSFPVEHDWLDNPDLRLIERSAGELRALADEKGWTRIVVPRPGCGGGGLDWASVRPVLERYFDDRFLVIDRGPVPAGAAGQEISSKRDVAGL